MPEPFDIPEEVVRELADAMAAPMRKLFAAWADELADHERAVAAVSLLDAIPKPDGEGGAWDLAELRTRTELMAAVNDDVHQALDQALEINGTLPVDFDSWTGEQIAAWLQDLDTEIEADALAVLHICRTNGLDPEA
jgi:hypothetical protein